MTKLYFLILTFGVQAFAATPPKTLKCDISYTFKSSDGTIQTEKHSVTATPTAETQLGVYSSSENYTSNDGRFLIRTFGQQMIDHPEITQSSIQVYDQQAKTGSQSGGLTLGGPSTPHNEVVFAYDEPTISDDPSNHMINVICDMK